MTHELASAAGTEAEGMPDRACRRIARIAWALLVPTAILAWIPVLASPRFNECFFHGTSCSPGAGTTAWWAFWASAVAGAAAALSPLQSNRKPRQLAMSVQLAAHALMTFAILAQAA